MRVRLPPLALNKGNLVSWYGDHPTLTKTQAKELLHPKACRITVYRVRLLTIHIEELPDFYAEPYICNRCGVTVNLLALYFEAKKRGWITL